MTQFSRDNPSPRYRELAALYVRMHAEGETRLGIPAHETFPGSSLLPHAARIKRLIAASGARTILDYGAGKGLQYRPQKITAEDGQVAESIAEFWDVDEVRCYDPGFGPHSVLPDETFDGVVCTDVLEHCPEDDLPWIVDEILGYARAFAYLNVACFPARKTLPNGENAHATVRAPDWWRGLAASRAKRHSALRWELHAAYLSGGQIAEQVFSGGETAVS
jgi:hypothetical protein